MASSCSRRGFLAVAGVASVSGCLRTVTGGPTADPGDESTVGDETSVGTADPTATRSSASGSGSGAAPPTADYVLPLPADGESLRKEARSGGPPKDGIPAIDSPKFVDATTADGRLKRGDIVFGVTRGDAVKAYPQNVLVWHEIVNDDLDGDPVSVTYCPLTGTVQGFDRGSTTFGVSGRLLNNNLIMYDRATENWWPQVLATAIPGPWSSSLAGKTLSEFRLVWTTWGKWRERHPATEVLSTDTGYGRNYERDPYGTYNPAGGYYTSDTTLFPQLNEDGRLHPKAVVMGVRAPGGGAAAVEKSVIRDAGLVEGSIDGTPLLWAYDPGFDTAYAYWNPEGIEFGFEGGSVAGPDGTHAAADLPLDRALTFDGMWFAWSGFYPGIEVYG